MQANVLTHVSQMVYIRQGCSFFKAHSTWKAATSAHPIQMLLHAADILESR